MWNQIRIFSEWKASGRSASPSVAVVRIKSEIRELSQRKKKGSEKGGSRVSVQERALKSRQVLLAVLL
jgi:hypothetical protein